MSELALKLIRECKETRSTRIDLGNCGLTELPDELFELVWLEELILSNEWDEVDCETFFTKEFFSQNKGNKNSIKFISPQIKNLPRLNKLIACGTFMSNWALKDLSPLTALAHLQQLNVSNTQVSDLSPLATLTQLKRLDVNNTQVNDLKPLAALTQLKRLDVSRTQVIDLSPLSTLTEVQELNLFNTKIINLNPITNLKQLRLLDFASTKIKDLSPLKDLNQLQLLKFYNTKKSKDLSPLKNLKQLKILWIEGVKVKSIKPLKELTELQQITISYINDLSPLKKIIEKGIKVRLGRGFDGIELIGCSLNNPPKEIVKQGNEAILNYWKQIEGQKGTIELFEAKLIIVGEAATGKTTLFEKIKDNNHQIGNTPETHGINIHEGLPFKHPHIGENIFHANLWDFGGQELQYMTHQFFLTPRALYVLMMDARRESPNLAYWFKIISLLGRDREDSTEKVQLLLVFNKRGNTTGTPPQYQDQLTYYADSLDVQYLEVDFAENDYRFDNLQNAIKQSLVTLPIVKSQLPRLWKVVREDLRDTAKKECYITTKHFSEICSKHGIIEEADQWLLSGYLHQLGSLLHFQNDKGLRRLVILSPQWAVDGVYTFLSEESIARNNGRFTEDEFMALLATKNYNRNDADVILQLMTKNNFDICYEATEHNYVAAQLLPDNAPHYQWFPKEVLQFRYQYPIMPKGLMSRLIVRLSDDIERDAASGEQIVWKKGVVLHIKLKEGECRVRLREDDAESKAGLRQILIDVMGECDARKYALSHVRKTVEDLHKKWFRSIKADEMVPCCCSECVVSDTPQLYKLENLLKLKEKRPNAVCYSSGDDVSIQHLLEGVYDKNEINNMDNQRGF